MIIFDCDGVLIDSERICNQILSECIAKLGLTLTLEQTIAHFKGYSSADSLSILETLLGRPVPPTFVADFEAIYLEQFPTRIRAIPGVVELIRSLDLPFCVASNSSHHHIRVGLTHSGLLSYFEGRIFSVQDVARGKPEPDLFLHAARSMGVEPAQCLVVEDSVAGVRAAVSAGMPVYGFADLTAAEVLANEGARPFYQMQDLVGLLSPA